MLAQTLDLSPRAARAVLAALDRADERDRLSRYRPYPKQLEFHAAGAAYRERLFMAGNQVGKTWAGAFEVALHLTGRYPDWWPGRRWDRPTRWWAAGITGESTRDNPQRLLVGPPADKTMWGTAALPAEDIAATQTGRGMPDALDTVTVRHVTGKNSYLAFKAYEKGREKWQGETLDGIWFDEEPSADIYIEGLTRTNATGGIVFITATPLLGMSEVVRMFLDAAK